MTSSRSPRLYLAGLAVILLASLLVACGAPETSDSGESLKPATSGGGGEDAASSAGGGGEITADSPSWASFELRDVVTGESFTVADLAGKRVLIQAFATW